MSERMRGARPRAAKMATDLGFLLGLGMFIYGLSLAWRPLGFIAGGLALALGNFLAGYQRPRKEGE